MESKEYVYSEVSEVLGKQLILYQRAEVLAISCILGFHMIFYGKEENDVLLIQIVKS